MCSFWISFDSKKKNFTWNLKKPKVVNFIICENSFIIRFNVFWMSKIYGVSLN